MVRDELKARGWTQGDLAAVMGRPPRLISELVNLKRRVTAQTAHELGAAFGTSPDLWMKIEAAWQLARVKIDDKTIRERARMLEQQKGPTHAPR